MAEDLFRLAFEFKKASADVLFKESGLERCYDAVALQKKIYEKHKCSRDSLLRVGEHEDAEELERKRRSYNNTLELYEERVLDAIDDARRMFANYEASKKYAHDLGVALMKARKEVDKDAYKTHLEEKLAHIGARIFEESELLVASTDEGKSEELSWSIDWLQSQEKFILREFVILTLK